MNIKEKLADEHSMRISQEIQQYVKDDLSLFSELIDILLGDEKKIAQRAALAVNWCFDYDPAGFKNEADRLIKAFLKRKDIHVAIRRCIIRNLQFIEVPEKYQAQLFDRFLLILHQEDETIAVKAFSMRVAYNICKELPELKVELEEAIRLNLEQSTSAGVQNRGKKILKKLAKL
ncbi:MAG: hypothetical protein CMP59_04470 [Flavobacteriales bacterium]|nr:hypothetical protein [Flavobacteriales bacterium]